jgi:hypothetical protein
MMSVASIVDHVQEVQRTPNTSAVGREATRVSEGQAAIAARRLGLPTGWSLQAAISDVLAVARDASTDDWDGEGSRRVSRGSIVYAMDFLRDLPLAVEPPLVDVDRDGEVAFEWIKGPGWRLIVTVGERGDLTYAALLGGDRMRGKESYFSNGLPEGVRTAFRRLFRF